MNALDTTSSTYGATAVVTHRIRPGMQADYEGYLGEITPLAAAAPGYLDLQWIRPIAGLTSTNTIIIRFDSVDLLKNWMDSVSRTEWIKRVSPVFVTGDDFFVSSGLDFWFASPDAKTRIPARWKQFLITWSAIFPLVTIVSFVLRRTFGLLHFPGNLLVTPLVLTGIVVSLMVYVVMPRYTKLVKRWLAA